jgi:hypothetical protein
MMHAQSNKEYLGRTSMEMLDDQQSVPDVSAEQRASNELIKRIRKLRWMGMREEAERVQMQSGVAPYPACGQRARNSQL